MATLLDWGNVEAALKLVEENHATRNEDAFGLLCLSAELRLDFDEARACLTDGANDRGIDAVYLDERASRRIVHLFQFKRRLSFNKGDRHFPSTEIDKVLGFLNDCFSQTKGFLDSCNPLLRQKVTDIWDFIGKGQVHVVIHLSSNGLPLLKDHRERLEASIQKFKFIEISELDLDGLSDLISRRSPREKSIELRVVEEQVFERTDGNVRAVIGTVRADEFIEAITDDLRPNQLDDFLFEENVRVYLGEHNSINRRIYETAISDESALFWYYNNGITIVCENFSYQPGFRNAPLTLRNPQIVNGGQTSYALFEASKVSFDSLQKVRLLVRIIETKDHTLYAKVAEATNSQTPIRSRDLRSNDPVLIKLENSLRPYGWFFDRKRDQHSNISDVERIDALKLGQIWLAYVRGEPDKAKTASDRIFGEYFSLIFDPDEMNAERVVSVWKIYNLIENEKRRVQELLRQDRVTRYSRYEEPFWIIEGMYHLAYALRVAAEDHDCDIYNFDAVRDFFGEAKSNITEFVKKQPRASYYRLFRTAETKSQIFRSAEERKQLELFSEDSSNENL